MDAITQIQSELSKAGEDPKAEALLADLESCRITPDKEIPPMQFLFQMFCKPCFPRGELVAISGKPKSGKTFVSSILMTLCFREEVLTVRRLEPEPLRILWFDTEQSEESTQDILVNRIMPMIEAPSISPRRGEFLDTQAIESQQSDQTISSSPWGRLGGAFHIFNVRPKFWQERMPLLEAGMRKYKPDLVILDGIRDLVSDINDGEMSQDIIERLMHLAGDLRCCIACILHQNKSPEDKNLRGWIGTELKNKAFEVYECTKDSDRIFTWSQTDTRKYDILDKLKYTVGDDGIPHLCSVEQLIDAQRNNEATEIDGRVAINPKYLLGYDGKFPILDITHLFPDAFRPGEVKSASALQATIMKMASITSYKFYNRRREEALAQGLIQQISTNENHVAYICPSKPAVAEKEPEQLDLFTNTISDGNVPF